jgi:hypothetical protein
MVGLGRNLHPNAAAGIEADSSLFFSDGELNLEGEKTKLSVKYSTCRYFFRVSPEL